MQGFTDENYFNLWGFDLFHVGPVRLLKRLRAMGDRLVIGISLNEFNALKGKTSFSSYDERAEIVESCQYVSEDFTERKGEQNEVGIKRFGADIFSMGADCKDQLDHLSAFCEVLYLERTESISTIEIKQSLSNINAKALDEFELSLHKIISVVKLLTAR
jgi:glycerol-3-phosphate cytidylyltransferase